MKIKAVGAYSAKQPLEPMDITRREPGPNDVKIEIAYCGVCHSDLHQVRSEWAGTVYPCVPGHEIVGRVVAVGDQVEKHAPGDLVGVGCIVDSCKHCEECEVGLENYCDHMTGTYNSPTPDEPGHTLGGYSQQIVVHERYVLRIRHPQEIADAAAKSAVIDPVGYASPSQGTSFSNEVIFTFSGDSGAVRQAVIAAREVGLQLLSTLDPVEIKSTTTPYI